MTVNEAVIQADDFVKNNPISRDVKITWLSLLDHFLYVDVIETHEDGDSTSFTPYEDGADEELLVPSPYSALYVEYLKMKIFGEMHEYTRYNNSMLIFDKMLTSWRRAYHSAHRPKAETSMKYM